MIGALIIVAVAILSLLVGIYQGWRIGLRQGITAGYRVGAWVTEQRLRPPV